MQEPMSLEASEAEPGGEDQIVDQIGMLMSQLSAEKQQAVLAKLGEMAMGAEPVGTSSVEGGPNGVPVGV